MTEKDKGHLEGSPVSDLHSSTDSLKDYQTADLSENDDTELELQDISADSESECDLEFQEEVSFAKCDEDQVDQLAVSINKNHIISCDALIPLGDDDGDIDSEEEHDLLQEIKEEIQELVRQEMKEELDEYSHKLDALKQKQLTDSAPSVDTSSAPLNNTASAPLNHTGSRDEEDGLEDLDPKLREAYIKMRKLDRILAKKLKQEKEVKRDRMTLEKRIRKELAQLKSTGRIQKDIQSNTDKFVALALPPSHNEGVDVDPRPVSPVFQTQLNEQHFQESEGNNKEESISEGSCSTSNVDQEGENYQNDYKQREKQKQKNFIRRNKELAAKGESVAMTDTEKCRVRELMDDVDTLFEHSDKEEVIEQESVCQSLNLKVSGGYNPDPTEQTSLIRIDSRLRDLLPNDEYQSLVCVPRDPEQHKCFTRVDVMSCIDNDKYGERALLETKEERDMNLRLKAIEEQLAYFHHPEQCEVTPSGLSEYELHTLVDECIRSFSRTSYADTALQDNLSDRSEYSSWRQSVMENPPHLPDEVLQKLLAEAQFPLSTRLGGVDEHDDSSPVEGGEPKPILAETWKTIAEQDESFDPIKSADCLSRNCWSRASSTNTRVHSSLGRPASNVSYEDSDTFDEEFVEPKRLVLPEISSSPYLVSQSQNNEVSHSNYPCRRNNHTVNSRTSNEMLRNSPINKFNNKTSDLSTPNFDSTVVMSQRSTGDRQSTSGQNSRTLASVMSRISSPTVKSLDQL